jgi:hypothetical protein
MRNLIIGAVAAAALLVAPAAAEAATADPPWTPVTNPLGARSHHGSITLQGGEFCVFAVNVAVVANNELKQVTALADGTTIIRLKGELVLSFKNKTSGKSIEEDVSGPSTTTISPDGGSATFQGAGPHWLAFGPQSKANTGEPGLVFTSGEITVTYVGITVQAFSLNGTQENGCALLS